MVPYKLVAIPFAIVSFALVGYDRIAAEWHRYELRKSIHARVLADDARLSYLPPAERMRTIMRAAEGDARRRGEPFRYRVQARTGEVEIVVDAAYRTLLTKWIGTTELPAGFALTFRHGDPS